MRTVIVMGLMAIVMGAEGCGEAEPEPLTFGCWGDPVSSAWATDTNWQSVTGAGDYGWRTERVRFRVGHEFSVDLETSDHGGEASSTQRRVYLECSDGNFYYEPESWDGGTDLINPGCPFPKTVVRAQAQVRVASCS